MPRRDRQLDDQIPSLLPAPLLCESGLAQSLASFAVVYNIPTNGEGRECNADATTAFRTSIGKFE
jgi:hypothetical protein